MTGSSSFDLSQLVDLFDRLHIALAFMLIGILATMSVCVWFFFRTVSEGVLAFYDCLTRCAEAKDRFSRTQRQRSRPGKAKRAQRALAQGPRKWDPSGPPS
jgi:hypothetical protein